MSEIAQNNSRQNWRDRAKVLLDQGLSFSAVARQLKVDRQLVHYHFGPNAKDRKRARQRANQSAEVQEHQRAYKRRYQRAARLAQLAGCTTREALAMMKD